MRIVIRSLHDPSAATDREGWQRVPPNRIDLATSVDGVAFDEAWSEKVESTYGGNTVRVISRKHLMQNRRASMRPMDLVDVEMLERYDPAR